MTKSIAERSGRITPFDHTSFVVTAMARFVVSKRTARVDAKNFGSDGRM
jgi:hypothetical protein